MLHPISILSPSEMLRRLFGHVLGDLLPSRGLVRVAVTTATLSVAAVLPAAEDYGDYYGVITDPHGPEVETPPDDGSPPILGTNYGPPKVRDLKKNNLNESTGVVLNRVYPDTAADSMGLQKGDIITRIGDTEIDSMQSVRDEVMSNSPGDPVQVTYLRNGEERTTSGNYGRWPDSIPYQPIDEDADRRYRSIQDRRLANQKDRPNAGPRRPQSPLTPAGAASGGLGSLAERAVERHEEAAAARTPAKTGDRVIVAGLVMTRGLPAWKFDYSVAVAPDDEAAAQPVVAGVAESHSDSNLSSTGSTTIDPVLALRNRHCGATLFVELSCQCGAWCLCKIDSGKIARK